MTIIALNYLEIKIICYLRKVKSDGISSFKYLLYLGIIFAVHYISLGMTSSRFPKLIYAF